MDQNSLRSNEERELVFPESVGFDNYSNCIQPDSVNSPCGCTNCSSTTSNNNLHLHEQVSLAQYSTHINHHVNEQVSSMPQDIGNANNDHIIPTTQYSPLSVPMYVNEQTSQYSPIQHVCQQQSISNFPSSTELFKIEISGIEIIVRRKSPPDLNQNYLEIMQNERNRQPQQNEQSTLKDHIRGNRTHPYHMSTEKNCRHNKINKRDNDVIDSFPQQHQYCSCSAVPQLDQQQNHVNRINRTNGTSTGGSSLNAQNTRINQSDNQSQFH